MRSSATILGFAANVCLLASMQLFVVPANAASPAPPKVFGGAQIQEVYRIRLDRGDLVLESLNSIIKEFNIQDGAVLTGVGSVQECNYHGVQSLAPSAQDHVTKAKGPMEILNMDGIIANGEPHVHITLSDIKKGAFGGHLDEGCRVLYRVEPTVAKFSGTPLARKLDQDGTPILQAK
jgi:predicted DNA-binding protein with PD1-like motif